MFSVAKLFCCLACILVHGPHVHAYCCYRMEIKSGKRQGGQEILYCTYIYRVGKESMWLICLLGVARPAVLRGF